MLKMKIIRSQDEFPKDLTKEKFIDFMHEHLGQYGDPKDEIEASIDYAFSDSEGKGGFLIAAYHEDKLVGGLINNLTGMKGYIPENLLVYVAVDAKMRGRGFGGKIMKEAMDLCEGDIKLHVEYDNRAKNLYERLGFESKYADMRYSKKED